MDGGTCYMSGEKNRGSHGGLAGIVARNGKRAVSGDAHAKRAFEPITQESIERLKSPSALARSDVAYGACIFGLLNAWISLSVFFLGGFSSTGGIPWKFSLQLVSVGSMVAVLAFCAAFPRMRGALGACFKASTAAAVVLIEAYAALDLVGVSHVAVDVLVVAVSAVGGVALGSTSACWATRFAARIGNTSVQVGAGLVVSGVIVGLVKLVPYPVSAFVWPVIPALLLVSMVLRHRKADDAGEKKDRPAEEAWSASEVSGKLKMALVVVGLGCGLIVGYASSFPETAFPVSVAAILASVFVGAVIAVYAAVTGYNFGYSSASLAVLPLMVIGEAIVGVFGRPGLPVGIFFQIAAFLAFLSVIWTQLPKIYEWGKNIRGFFYINALLYGSFFVGLALRALLFYDKGVAFQFVTVGIIALTVVSLSLAFQGEGVVTVWDLMPLPETRRGKGYRVACEEIKAEYHLTNREFEVMYLAARGRSGAYIQDKLCIAMGTFQTHMRNIYRKIDVHSNQELIDLVEEHLKR